MYLCVCAILCFIRFNRMAILVFLISQMFGPAEQTISVVGLQDWGDASTWGMYPLVN